MKKFAIVQYLWKEKLGGMHISSVLKSNGHDCKVFLGNNNKILGKKILEYKPDLIGFYCITGTNQWVDEKTEFIKKYINKDIPIIVGGPHPTFFPDYLKKSQYVDIICRGEGEYPVLELLNKLDSGEDITTIKNLSVKIDGTIISNDFRPLIQDLDSLPFPDRALYDEHDFIRNAPINLFMGSRGCPYKCAFCFEPSYREMFKGKGEKFMRRRSSDNLIAELIEVRNRYGLKSVFFHDDLFTIDKKWLLEFLEKYKKHIRTQFFCQTRADLLNEEIIIALKEANCYWVDIALESGNEQLRNMVLQKNLKNESLIEAAMLLRKHNIRFNTNIMFGLPSETFEQALETISFTIKLKPNVVWCSVFQPYPGTKLGNLCIEQGLVNSNEINPHNATSHSKNSLKQKDINKITNLHKFAYIAIKYPRTIPFIKQLVKLPPNFIFYLIHRLTYMLFYYSKVMPMSIIRLAKEVYVFIKIGAR